MPLTPSVAKNIRELKAAHGGEKAWPMKRIVAAALNAARTKGGDVEPPHLPTLSPPDPGERAARRRRLKVTI